MGVVAFFGVSALAFAASAAATVAWCTSMPEMGGMTTGTRPGNAASFAGMWIVMMVAMMLPSVVPVLWRYRQAVDRAGGAHPGRLAVLVAAAYFLVWAAVGVVAFAPVVALTAIDIPQPALSRAAPIGVALVVLVAGVLQLTAWKARHLSWCREAQPPGHVQVAAAGAAWRHGLWLGLHCSRSCAGLMAIVLAFGVMNLRTMAAVTVAITAERLAPAGERAARAIGVALVVTGLLLVTRVASGM